MAIPSITTASIHSQVASDKKTYLYTFDHKPSFGSPVTAGPDWLQTSASHGDDIIFVFGSSVSLTTIITSLISSLNLDLNIS